MPARAELIAAAADVIAARKDELPRLVAREAGKILVEAGGDVQEAVDMGRFVAGQGRAPPGATVPSELPGKLAWTTRQPVGVVGMITPWNFPVAIPSWKIFPALLAGNGIVIKPSRARPACAPRPSSTACVQAGRAPPTSSTSCTGSPSRRRRIAVHPGVGAVSFTGSVPTGRKVAAAAMETGPRLVSLELGGKNAMVVLADADLDLAVDGAIFGAFGTAGQRCTSTSRLIVHRDVADELVDRVAERAAELVARRPARPGHRRRPGHQRRQRPIASWPWSTRAVAEGGARRVPAATGVAVDGCDGGTFVAPTCAGVARRPPHRPRRGLRAGARGHRGRRPRRGRRRRQRHRVRAVGRHLHRATSTRRSRAVERIDTGIVYVNAPTIGAEIPLPFGGTKHTGNGFREAGTRGIEQFSQVKTVYVDYSGRLQKAQIDNRTADARRPAHDRHRSIDATAEWLARDEAALAPVLSRHTSTSSPARARGRWLTDVDGRRYLDLTSGIAVTNVGHCHPRVVAGRRGPAARG